MLPDFPNLKRRLLRLAEFDFHQRVQADGLIGATLACLPQRMGSEIIVSGNGFCGLHGGTPTTEKP
jgi:hypothetical protein